VPGTGLQTEFVDLTPEKKASAEQSIETVHLCASLLRARLSMDTVLSFLG
jgi:hypothetical protein